MFGRLSLRHQDCAFKQMQADSELDVVAYDNREARGGHGRRCNPRQRHTRAGERIASHHAGNCSLHMSDGVDPFLTRKFHPAASSVRRPQEPTPDGDDLQMRRRSSLFAARRTPTTVRSSLLMQSSCRRENTALAKLEQHEQFLALDAAAELTLQVPW